jgi:hypothetical protein
MRLDPWLDDGPRKQGAYQRATQGGISDSLTCFLCVGTGTGLARHIVLHSVASATLDLEDFVTDAGAGSVGLQRAIDPVRP